MKETKDKTVQELRKEIMEKTSVNAFCAIIWSQMSKHLKPTMNNVLSMSWEMMALIDKFGELKLEKSTNYFEDLCRQVTGQQLSVKAASSIWQRVINLFDEVITPEKVLNSDDDILRGAGLSYAKIRTLKAIGQAISNGIINLDELDKVDDEEVIAKLTIIKGIGRWTAEMFLIFTLARPDVFSYGDAGLRAAMQKIFPRPPQMDGHYELKSLENVRKQMDDIGRMKSYEQLINSWRPYRSYACLYLWKSLDNTPK